MDSSVNFTGLPQNLQKRILNGITASDVKVITLDAARKAGAKTPLNVQPKLIREYNADLFTKSGIISDEGAEKLCKEYGCKNTCTALRDAFANLMKKFGDEPIDYNRIL